MLGPLTFQAPIAAEEGELDPEDLEQMVPPLPPDADAAAEERQQEHDVQVKVAAMSAAAAAQPGGRCAAYLDTLFAQIMLGKELEFWVQGSGAPPLQSPLPPLISGGSRGPQQARAAFLQEAAAHR